MRNDFKDGGKEEIMPTEETELVERAKTDDSAFEILYNFYFPKIYGYIFKRVGCFDVAQDLVSVTFLKVFNGLEKYQNKGIPFSAWVYKIATNNLVDYYRKEAKNKKIDIDKLNNLEDDKNEDFGANFDILQEKKIVHEILKKIPENHQRILYLKFFAEKETKEIAEILQINENNARVLLFRALKKFNEAYKSYVK